MTGVVGAAATDVARVVRGANCGTLTAGRLSPIPRYR